MEETKPVIVYKIVRHTPRLKLFGKIFKPILESAIAAKNNWSLEYAPNEVTRPKIGKIFAFKTLLDAKTWWSSCKRDVDFSIWKCEATDAIDAVFCVNNVGADSKREAKESTKEIQRFWSHPISESTYKYHISGFSGHRNVPVGTVYCGSLKLLERVA